MKLSLPYGNRRAEANLRTGRRLGELSVREAPPLAQLEDRVREVLRSPIGLREKLLSWVKGGESIAVVVSDSFRKTGVEKLLPTLVKEIREAGAQDEDISFTFATGIHRGPTPDEQREILGPAIHERFRERLYNHDAHDAANLVYIGTTKRGTPVEVNRRVHESKRVIATGSVVLHYFGGFGGGRKAIVPGLASAKTIAHNHAMNLDPDEDRLDPAVRIGALDGNPVAEDMLEATRLTHVDGIVNTVLNGKGEIAGIFAGELDAAHRCATEFALGLFSVTIPEKADLVIAASPDTLNFVQTHKALFNAFQAVKPSGRIVLLAPCSEGLGGETFEKWLRLGSRSAIFKALREQSEINGQTALSTIEKAPITDFVTDLSAEDIGLLQGRKAASLQEAIDQALESLALEGRTDPTCYVMPNAAYTVPYRP